MSEDLSTEKSEADGYRIVRLAASNIKRLKAVDITPKPGAPVVILAGNNGEGKTSVLDAMMWALGGAITVAKDPIRHGQTKATTEVDLGGVIARRTITNRGQSLELKRADGKDIEQPQTFLDNLLGRLTFDPLDFSRMAPGKRLQTLLSLVPLSIDLDQIADQRKVLFDKRHDLKALHRDRIGQLREPEPDADLPTELIDVSALVEEKNVLESQKTENQRIRSAANVALHLKEKYDQELGELTVTELAMRKRHGEELAELERRHHVESSAMTATLAEKRELVVGQTRLAEDSEKEVLALVDPDTSTIDAEISAASEINRKIESGQRWREAAVKIKGLEKEIDTYSEQIEAIDHQKEEALAAAKFPVDGLSFADGDVMFNGVLFDQLSSSEQLRVSLAMAMAMNPRLRVIRITDGSLLDETSLGIVRDMAAEHGYQVWLEVVGPRADATVVIEDGEVVGNGSK